MPDGTSRFSIDGKTIYHFMGCSTFSEYTVVSEISCAKIADDAPLDKICLFGCGVSTGLGAAWNTCDIEEGTTVAVFGLGAVGLAIIQGAKTRKATRIFAIDINPAKFDLARALGATDVINPSELPVGVSAQSHIVSQTTWGVDYSFDATGNVQVMRAALECSHRGWGQSCVVGVAPAGHEISTRPFQLVTGRQWKGTAFGGFKSRSQVRVSRELHIIDFSNHISTRLQVPKLVDRYLAGDLPIEHFITHKLEGVDSINTAMNIMLEKNCLRAVVKY